MSHELSRKPKNHSLLWIDNGNIGKGYQRARRQWRDPVLLIGVVSDNLPHLFGLILRLNNVSQELEGRERFRNKMPVRRVLHTDSIKLGFVPASAGYRPRELLLLESICEITTAAIDITGREWLQRCVSV